MRNKFIFKKQRLFIGVVSVILLLFFASILHNIWIGRIEPTPIEKCRLQYLGRLRFALDHFYREYGHYPTSKGDEFFRELYYKCPIEYLPLCPGKIEISLGTKNYSYRTAEKIFHDTKRVDYETWPEGFPPEDILTSPPDGYPILWDKKGNHKEGRNVMILSKDSFIKISDQSPYDKYGPLVDYSSPDFILLNEDEFEKYLNKYRLR